MRNELGHTPLLLRLIVIPLALVGFGCGISRQQEIEIGREARPQFEQEFGGLHPDESLQQYVQEVGMDLVRYTDRPNLPWEFRVLNSDQINAFALPGGFVYITQGMLQRLDDEAQLAAVLGHEAAHVAHRHSVQQLQRAQLVQGGTALASIFGASPQIANIAQLVTGLALMKYSRDQEQEADLSGLKYLAREGYEPAAMLGVMQTLAEASGDGGPPEFLSSHPAPANREEYLSRRIEREWPEKISVGRRDREEYQRRVLRGGATSSTPGAEASPAAAPVVP